MSEKQTVEVQKEVTGSTVISFTKPTPMWATWIFRIEFLANKAFLMVLSQGLMPGLDTEKAVGWAVIIDFLVWGMGRGIGVKKESFENE